MTRAFASPRAGSRAYRALEKLHSIGGQAGLMEFMRATEWTGAILEFEREIIGGLIRSKHIFLRGQVYILTDDGMDHIGQSEAVDPATVVVAGPGYVAPIRPLSARHRPRVMLTREGAFDYRDVPSRHGDERVEFRSSLDVAGGQLAVQKGGRR